MGALFALLLIPPPVIQWPAQPSKFPEYAATCRLTDVDGFATSATLLVSGQGDARRMELVLHRASKAWPKKLLVTPSWPRSGAWDDGIAYRYDEYGNIRTPDFLQLEVAGLGPRLDTLRIEVKRRSNSQVFERPGLIGACRVRGRP